MSKHRYDVPICFTAPHFELKTFVNKNIEGKKKKTKKKPTTTPLTNRKERDAGKAQWANILLELHSQVKCYMYILANNELTLFLKH